MKYIFFIILFLALVLFFYKKEHFTEVSNDSIILKDKSQITNILPYKNENGNMEHIITILFNNGTYFPNHIYKIYNLKTINDSSTSNQHTPLKNGMVDKNTIIVDLNWHRDEEKDGLSMGKRLMCVGLKYNNNVPEYTIYIKETIDIESMWVVYEICYSSSCNPIDNKRIKSIVYDLHDNLLGIDCKNNQIYQLYENNNPKWVGPFSYDKDVKIHKIMFNLDKKMIAIDNYGKIHIKNDINWKYSNWKKNQTKDVSSRPIIFDMVYDFDGKYILLVDKKPFIFKQKNLNIFSLNFDDYFENKTLKKPILPLNDVIMYKTGIDSDKFDYLTLVDKNSLSKHELMRKTITMINLNHNLKLKRKLLSKCNNMKSQFSNTYDLKKQKNSHKPLYQTIDDLITKLEDTRE